MESRQEPLFQVNHSFTNQIVPTQVVIIHDLNLKVLHFGNLCFELEHLSKQWVERIGLEIVLFIIFLLPKRHNEVWVSLREHNLKKNRHQLQ